MAKTFSVSEYTKISADDFLGSESTFNSFRDFLLSDNFRKKYDYGVVDYYKKNQKEYIKVNNYVGVISMKNGDVIEILPKTYDGTNAEESRKLVMRMVKSLRASNYKNASLSNMKIDKMPLMEIFIRMFIDETYELVKRGIRSGYVTVSENITTCKGHINFSEQIKRNYAHAERFCVEYDEYNYNRPENKLIKSTLLFLDKRSTSFENKADIKALLSMFDEVEESLNHDFDFSKCIDERNMKDYQMILSWCKVFLENKSFTSYSGEHVACAILFPMEKLFESYVAQQFKKMLKETEYSVSSQDKGYYLFDRCNDEKQRGFALRPDIVISKGNDLFIADTKWKLISDKNDISQQDMYQMYAYQKKYTSGEKTCHNVTLIYPDIGQYTRDFKEKYHCDHMTFTSEHDREKVYVIFVDLTLDEKAFRNELYNVFYGYITNTSDNNLSYLVEIDNSVVETVRR